MTRITKILGGIATAGLLATASPAGAQPYPYPYDDRDDGISARDIAGAVAAVGAIAGAVNAVTGRGYAPYGGYGYPQSYGYQQPGYGYGYPNAGYGSNYGYAGGGYGYGAAANSCGAEAQRYARGGQVRVTDVDQVSGGRFRVRGTFDELRHDRYGRIRTDREGFSCLAFGDGRILDFDR
ncbi:hypothetical protein [Sphingosinicella sp. YJ22]|uniref:hypothetical protein n=1 Tax=Sphingosinicella sp. YJ22 TaxID=1104780 RepID=UPI001A9C326C|nr:hypothetical protein [Sphingosinicella sp. YJ22]